MPKHSVRSLFVAFLLVLPLYGFGTPHSKIVNRTMGSVVRITGQKDMETFFGTVHGDYICSGFVIAKNRVLTAAHCRGDMMRVDGYATDVLKFDEFYDLALLDVKTSKRPLELSRETVTRGDHLTAIGYGFGWTNMWSLEVLVDIVDYSPQPDLPPGIWVQGQYIGGMSGGPVIDDKGRVIGMVQRAGEGTGYGVGTLLMKAFLLGTN